ncbi:MAG: hypothetical protein IJD39_09390 [Clostridia bacterium]|nr:hypothetical protein [Clostridia bacterium]
MKLSRKWILVAALVMSVAMATSGTLAYLTDRDSEVNVFTFGNVDIELNEEFTQGTALIPGVTIEKAATITNKGTTDAWVWYTLAIPTALDSETASDNVIHTNVPGRNWFGYHTNQNYWLEGQTEAVADEKTWIVDAPVFANDAKSITTTINGVECTLYAHLYKGTLAPGETTTVGLNQVYLDYHIDIDPEGNLHHVEGGVVTDIDWNINEDGSPVIYLAAYAIQKDGFDSVEKAFAAYTEQWGDNGGVEFATPSIVTNEADMYAALDNGATDLIVKGVTITENNFNGHYYKDRNIDFVDCTFTANMNYMYINDASFTNCTFNCGSANAAVHYDELFGDLVFNNCKFNSGKIQIGANKDMTGTVTFNDCTFAETASTSIWSEAGIRVYSPATFNGCEFNNRVVLAGSNGLPITFDSCTMKGGTPVYYVDNTDGIIRGGNTPVVTIN